MRLIPIGDQVLVKVDVEETFSEGGLILPPSQEPVSKSTGVVEAVGDHEVIKVSPGDWVAMEKGMGRRIKLPITRENSKGMKWTEQVEYVLVSYYDVLAVLSYDIGETPDVKFDKREVKT